MSNMSYCRFRNTLQDLQDCIDALENYDDEEEGFLELSHEERRAADSMYEQCRIYMELYDDAIEVEEHFEKRIERENERDDIH